jgi:hypothetical protein
MNWRSSSDLPQFWPGSPSGGFAARVRLSSWQRMEVEGTRADRWARLSGPAHLLWARRSSSWHQLGATTETLVAAALLCRHDLLDLAERLFQYRNMSSDLRI